MGSTYLCSDRFEIKKKLKTAKKKEKEEKKKKQEEEQEKRKLSQVQDTQVVSFMDVLNNLRLIVGHKLCKLCLSAEIVYEL